MTSKNASAASEPATSLTDKEREAIAQMPYEEARDKLIQAVQALEAGVGIQYTLGMRNVDLAAEAGSEYGYCTASLWMDEAAANWNEAADYLRQVSDQAVASHEQLSAGVYRTVFANGLGVIVNYTDADAAADGQTIPAKGFVPIGW